MWVFFNEGKIQLQLFISLFESISFEHKKEINLDLNSLDYVYQLSSNCLVTVQQLSRH